MLLEIRRDFVGKLTVSSLVHVQWMPHSGKHKTVLVIDQLKAVERGLPGRALSDLGCVHCVFPFLVGPLDFERAFFFRGQESESPSEVRSPFGHPARKRC